VSAGGWQATVERTVAGLGYDLVDIERGQRGLLRVTIDRLPGQRYEPEGEFVTVEDCERVTRQLQLVLEVDGLAYERLEVSSPGLDRPLRKPADWSRFAGESVSVTLKMPFEGRKVWKGRLEADPQAAEGGWMLVLEDEAAAAKGAKPGAKVSARPRKAAPAAPGRTLNFTLDEVREARLLPVVDFKGRKATGVAPAPAVPAEQDGGVEE
jgi:ribosome maturation factor RimP